MATLDTFYISLGLEDTKAIQQLKSFQNRLKKVNDTTGKTGVANQSGSSKLGGIASRFAPLAIGAGLLAGIKSTVSQASDIEEAMIGVGKTTNISGDELGALEDKLLGISKSLPVPTARLLEIAQAAGTVGIKGADNIAKFTEVVGKLDLATNDLNGEEAARSLARILNLSGESVGNVDKLASAMVSLGNNTTTTEGVIAHMATNLSTRVGQFNASSESIVALSGALAASGIQAEIASGTIQRTLSEMQRSFESGGNEAKVFADTAGVSVDELKKLFKQDGLKALALFTDGLAKQEKEGKSVISTLDKLKLSGVGYSTVLGTLASQNELVGKSFELVGQQYNNATALDEEAATASKAYNKSLQGLSNSLTSFANNVGEIFLPAASFIIDNLKSVIDFADRATTAIRSFFGGADEGQRKDIFKSQLKQSDDYIKGLIQKRNVALDENKINRANGINGKILVAEQKRIKRYGVPFQQKNEITMNVYGAGSPQSVAENVNANIAGALASATGSR